MKQGLTTFALSLIFTVIAHASDEASSQMPALPINLQSEEIVSTTMKPEESESQANQPTQIRRVCCLPYGYYCYTSPYRKLGDQCWCQAPDGFHTGGKVCYKYIRR